jgi:hypothetical protein
MQSVYYCCPSLTKIGICQQILAELPYVKFHDNTITGSQVVHVYGWTIGGCYLNRSSVGLLMRLKTQTMDKVLQNNYTPNKSSKPNEEQMTDTQENNSNLLHAIWCLA